MLSASCSFTGHLWEESDCLVQSSHNRNWHLLRKNPPEASLLQAKESELSQSVFVWWMLLFHHHFYGPVLDSFQEVHICLVRSDSMSAQKLTLHSKCGNAVLNGAPNGVSFPCYRSALLAYGWACSPTGSSAPVKLLCSCFVPSMYQCRVLLPRVQDLILSCTEHHEGAIRPFLQPVDVFLNGSRHIWCFNQPSPFLSFTDL